MFVKKGWFYSPEGDPPGGGNDGKGNPPQKTAEELAAEAEKNRLAAEKKFSQADVDRIVQDRLAREKQKAEEAQEEAKRKAAADALKENGEYKKLSEDQKVTIDSLMPFKTRVETLEGLLKAGVENALKTLPDSIKELVSALPVEKQFEWLQKNAASLGKGEIPGIPPTPDGEGAKPKSVSEISQAKGSADYTL